MRNVEIKRRQVQLISYALSIPVLMILAHNTGEFGILLVAVAIELCGFFLMLISGQLPDIMGRLLRSRTNKNQHKNVQQMKRNLGILQVILGILGTLLLVLLAGPISKYVFPLSHSYYLFLMISPLILLRTLNHVMLGWFQGSGNELPTVLTYGIRPLLWLVLGLALGKRYVNQGIQVGELLKQPDYKYVYAAMGVILAIVLAELILLILLAALTTIYYYNNRQTEKPGMKTTEHPAHLLRLYCKNRWLPTLQMFLLHFPIWLLLIGENVRKGAAGAGYQEFAIFYIKALGLLTMITFLGCAWFMPLSYKAVYNLKNEGSRYASESLRRGMIAVFSTMIFVGVFLWTMNSQLAKVLMGGSHAVLAKWLQIGAMLPAIWGLTYFFYRVLSLLKQKLILLAACGFADLLFLVLTLITMGKPEVSFNSYLINLLICSVILCVLLGFFCCVMFHLGPELAMPTLTATLAAGIVFVIQTALQSLLTPHLGAGVSLLVILVVTSILYLLLLLVFRVFRDDDFENLPAGRILLALGQMLHLY